MNGAEIELLQRDDGGDPASARPRRWRRSISEDEVLAVLGPTFSNSAAEADPIANKAGTPVLAVSNTGPGIVGDCPYPCDLVFRDSLGEADAIPANVANYAADSKAEDRGRRSSRSTTPSASRRAAIAAEALEENGIEVSGDRATSPRSRPGLSPRSSRRSRRTRTSSSSPPPRARSPRT